MFDHTVKSCETPEQKTRLITALNCVCTVRPYFSGLAVLLKIYVSEALKTAGITSSGRLIVNPYFMAQLKLQELVFVIAHELMHLVLQTHEREGNFPNHELVNIAHDFIINDDLLDDFDYPPAGGLNWMNYRHLVSDWKPASEYSLEELVSVLKQQNISPEQSWTVSEQLDLIPQDQKTKEEDDRSTSPTDSSSGGFSLGSILEAVGITAPELEEAPPQADPEPHEPEPEPILPKEPVVQNPWDVLSAEEESLIFPEMSQEAVTIEQKEIREAVVRSYSEAALENTLKKFELASGRGTTPGSWANTIEMLRASYITPWEAAIQKWFDSAMPGDRSFAKASRRGAWRTDVVLPGRKREGWTLHIVLDTSGSMSYALRSALGAIDQFCQNNNVDMIHILQCDTGVTEDEWVEVGSLGKFQAKGFGGSDMSPAMLRLAEDPEVTAVLVLTDGYIGYPEKEPPYETLWGIVDNGSTDFKYGTAIRIAPQR